MEEYETKYNLDNATRCFIELDGTTKDYTCEWNIESKDMMYSHYNAFVQQIAACKINGLTSISRVRSSPDSESKRSLVTDRETTSYKYTGDDAIELKASRHSRLSKVDDSVENIVTFKLENWSN
jgi:hypothetical protein